MIRRFLRWPLYLQTIVGMVVGVVLGLLLQKHTAQFGLVGKAIIQLIKAFATPLLFFAILDSLVQAQFRARGIAVMLAVSLFDATIAVAIALGINHLFHPGRYLVLPKELPPAPHAFAAIKNVNLVDGIFANVPEDLLSPFLHAAIPGVVIIAILLGIGINRLKRGEALHHTLGNSFDAPIHALYQLMLRVLEWIVRLVPLAVAAAVAQAVGMQGFAAFKGLGAYLAAAIVGMLLQVTFVYQSWIAFISRVGLRRFWKEAKEPLVYGAGINSSLATLPLTLQSLERMGVSPSSARLSACVGTNFNNDGILLYEAVAMLFIAQAYGISLTLGQQLSACLICMVTAFGIAGVPEAGIIGLALVLTSVGVPTEILPLLLAVDWIIARCRSATNVLSDLTVATVIDRFSPEVRVT